MQTDANPAAPGTMLLTPAQVAEELQVTRELVYRWCASGVLKSVALNGSHRARRITRAALLDFIDKQSATPNTAA